MRATKRLFTPGLPIMLAAAVLLTAEPAYAHDILKKGESLIRLMLSFLQTIASLMCVAAMIRAGLAFNEVNEYEQAIDRLKNTLIASTIVFGAVGIVQLIKTHIGIGTMQ